MIGLENVRTFTPGNCLDLNAISLYGFVVGSTDSCDGAVACLLHAPGVIGTNSTGADWC